MSSVAQMVNVLQAKILTEGERMVLMPLQHQMQCSPSPSRKPH